MLRIPPHNGKWRHIFGHDRACADNGPVMDLHAAFYGYIAANPDIRADFGIWITVKFLLDAEIVENIIYCGVKICQGGGCQSVNRMRICKIHRVGYAAIIAARRKSK